MLKRLRARSKRGSVAGSMVSSPSVVRPPVVAPEAIGAVDSPSSAPLHDYDNIPAHATITPTRFRVLIPEQQISDMKMLIRLSKVGPKTYENTRGDRKLGINHAWFSEAKEYWETKFDWRATEAHINTYTQYEVAIKDDNDESLAIHFTGLFSKHAEAIPIVLLHGWPGSFLEFLKMLDLLRAKYTPEELPYHVVVPSLPGYAFSTGPPLETEWATEDAARIINKLMVGLGFGEGYVAHGGDIGSMIARVLAKTYEPCKAMHVNFNIMGAAPEAAADKSLTSAEQQGLARAADFGTLGNAYAREHGTRPATIGLTLSTNPLALLAWIGEKYLTWTDADPSLDTILESVTLYWLTQTFPRSIYFYVQYFGDSPRSSNIHADPSYHCLKPFGYSWFPKEIAPIPVSWVATTGNLIWSRSHTEGGHFAALEKPELLLADIEDFMKELQ